MSNEKTFCRQCGLELIDEGSIREPCNNCGGNERTFNVSATANVNVGTHVNVTVISYPETLLSLSKKLISESQFGVSIVVAHMACEVSTERRIRSIAMKRELEDLLEIVQNSMNGYSLGNRKNLNIYKIFSRDLIQDQKFWASYKNSCSIRNKIIHEGFIASKEDAEKSYNSTSEFVSYMSL